VPLILLAQGLLCGLEICCILWESKGIQPTMSDFNREQLISDYVDRILDNMSTKDLMRIVGDQLEENLSGYTDEELISEVEEHYPELIQS
jgi:hypothetical protein